MRAARIRMGWLAREAWKASAVPWKLDRMPAGNPSSRSAAWTASTAWLRETPRARLKDRVTEGNWPWWLTDSGVVLGTKRVKPLMGTCAPVGDLTYTDLSASGFCWNCGSTSRTTRYWL